MLTLLTAFDLRKSAALRCRHGAIKTLKNESDTDFLLSMNR
jgi:hypothetical protein